MTEAVGVVLEFNEAINRRDIDALAELMTETHRFIDSAGVSVEGKDSCIEAWRGCFDTFPDYRNLLGRSRHPPRTFEPDS